MLSAGKASMSPTQQRKKESSTSSSLPLSTSLKQLEESLTRLYFDSKNDIESATNPQHRYPCTLRCQATSCPLAANSTKAKTASTTGRFQSAKRPIPLFDVSEDTGKFRQGDSRMLDKLNGKFWLPLLTTLPSRLLQTLEEASGHKARYIQIRVISSSLTCLNSWQRKCFRIISCLILLVTMPD